MTEVRCLDVPGVSGASSSRLGLLSNPSSKICALKNQLCVQLLRPLEAFAAHLLLHFILGVIFLFNIFFVCVNMPHVCGSYRGQKRVSDLPGAGVISGWPLSLLSTPKSRLPPGTEGVGDNKHLRRLTLLKTPCCLHVCLEQLGSLSMYGPQRSPGKVTITLAWVGALMGGVGPLRDKTSVTL